MRTTPLPHQNRSLEGANLAGILNLQYCSPVPIPNDAAEFKKPELRANPQSPTSSRQRPRRIPMHCAIPSSSSPPQMSTSAPLQPVLPEPSNSHFQHAEGVIVNGGRFTNSRGDVVNNVDIIIHLPKELMNGNGHEHPAVIAQPPSMEQDENTSTEVVSPQSKAMASADGDTTVEPNVPTRGPLPYEIYATLLAPKRPGWALWMPEPNNNLPTPYRKKGVQFGDVGIIAPDGSFSFIFNICVSRDDPINPRSLPDEFVPIHPPIDPIDIRRFAIFKAGSYLASTSIEKVENDVDSPELSFQCSGSEGAILTMPEGPISEDLEGLRKFREYAAANVKMWYKYIIGTRGREAKNGDVRLVVGCDKSTSWGVAALPNTSQHSKLKFTSLDAQTSDSRSPSYTWEHSGTADVRDGPAQEEIDALSREDTSDDLIQGKYLNQCLFVRTLNLELNAEDWENLIHEIGIGNTLSEPGTGTASHSPSNRGPSFGNTQAASSTSSNSGAQRTVSDAPVMELNSRGTTANRLTISMPPAATPYHPSHIVNETLLRKIPNARMAITHDEDWYSCIQSDMMMPSDPDKILSCLLTLNDVREDHGVVYLEPKVTREMKYFANLEKLSIELQQKELNLEQYLYGNDSGRAARWKEIVFLLQLCHDALSAPASDAVHGPLSCAPLPDIQRIREIETLIGSLLVDELYFDKPDAFRSIYALRTSSQGFEHYSSSFRRDTFQQVSSILGRDSTSMESFNSPVEFYGEMFDRDISWKRSRNFLAYSSHLYLLYLALGELADLQQVIKNFREQKLPESTSLDSLDLPPTEEVTNRNSDLSRDTECAELGPSCSTSELPQGGSHSSDDSRSGSEMEIDVDYVADGPSSVQGSLLFTDAGGRSPSWTDNLTLVGSESTFISDEKPDHKAMNWNPSKVQSSTASQHLENAAVGESSHRRSRHPSLDDSHNVRGGGCWTCRVRRKKCDPQGEGDSCKTCQRLRINCLGWGSKRPEWMRDKKNVDAYKASIKAQLSQAGLIRSQSRHQPPQVPKSSNDFFSLPHAGNVGAMGTDPSSWSGRSLPHPIVAQPMQMDVGESQAVNPPQEVVAAKIRPVSPPPATLQSHRRRGMYFAKGQEVYIREDSRALSAVVQQDTRPHDETVLVQIFGQHRYVLNDTDVIRSTS